MKTYIALLRGINVGGHKKTPMAELRALLEKKGLENVKTYIQSGNIVFQSSIKQKPEIEELIKIAILDNFGFEVPTLVKTRDELQTIFDQCPFQKEKKENSYFTLLFKEPDKNMIAEASNISYPNEEIIITPNCLYFYCEMGYGQAKFNGKLFEKKLDTTFTARNYRTMAKLLEMSA
jgi:uncharacterized protein (DUF1697 family)